MTLVCFRVSAALGEKLTFRNDRRRTPSFRFLASLARDCKRGRHLAPPFLFFFFPSLPTSPLELCTRSRTRPQSGEKIAHVINPFSTETVIMKPSRGLINLENDEFHLAFYCNYIGKRAKVCVINKDSQGTQVIQNFILHF